MRSKKKKTPETAISRGQIHEKYNYKLIIAQIEELIQ